jgi:macrodomain Ter protein organizer (MatP/YcbG family)
MSRTIQTKKVSISLTPEILERTEAYGNKLGISRATAISVLVSKALDQEDMQETIKNFNANSQILEDMKKTLEVFNQKHGKTK